MSDYFLNKIYDSLLSNKPVPKKPEPIVEKKETFKPLSKVYEVLVREKVEHVAIYGSKEDVDPKNIPDKTEQGLETLGVASKDLVSKLKRQINFEKSNVTALLDSVFVKANIPKRHREAFPAIYQTLLESGFPYVEQLLEKIITNKGIFNIEETNTYNTINTATNKTIQVLSDITDVSSYKDSLDQMFRTFITLDPKIGSTNIGPGEVFYSIFSNATIAKGEGEGKAGDLEVNGLEYEVKATTTKGARLGGSGMANKAMLEIPKKLGANFLGKIQFIIKSLNNVKNIFDSAVAGNISFEDFKRQIQTIARTPSLREYRLDKFENITSFNDLVSTSEGKWNRVAKGITFKQKYENFINNSVKEATAEATNLKTPQEDVTRRLDVLLYDAVNFLKKNQPNTPLEQIIDIVALVNNEDTVPVKDILRNFFKDTNTLYNYFANFENVTKFIGALHLYSYTVKTRYAKLLLINVPSGNVIIFNAPKTLEEAVTITNTDGVKFDTSVDYGAATRTERGKSVNILYKP